mmetsp:Transcript_19012/g.44354  ORF Transcript_19012/g.44354 Transcript_19012/m.44354 type:complete len:601 (-) Transcript_19012:92-1894(-)
MRIGGAPAGMAHQFMNSGKFAWSLIVLLLQVCVTVAAPSKAPQATESQAPPPKARKHDRMGLAAVPLPIPSLGGPTPAAVAGVLSLPVEALSSAGLQGAYGSWMYGAIAGGTGAAIASKRRHKRRGDRRGQSEAGRGSVIPVLVGQAATMQFATVTRTPAATAHHEAPVSRQASEEAQVDEEHEHWDTDSDDELRIHPQVQHYQPPIMPVLPHPMGLQQQAQFLAATSSVSTGTGMSTPLSSSSTPPPSHRGMKASRGAVSASEQEVMKKAVQEVMKRVDAKGAANSVPFVGAQVPSVQAAVVQAPAAAAKQPSQQTQRQQQQVDQPSTPTNDEPDVPDALPASFSMTSADEVNKELEDGTQEQREARLDWIISLAWPMALTKHGCHMVQTAFKVADSERQIALASKLRGHVLECVKSRHANFVLQKCVEYMPSSQVEFILTELRGQSAEVAKHRYGCRVLQRLLEHCHSQQTEDVVEEVLGGLVGLCRHAFGNYVVQHILEHGTDAQKNQIAEILVSDEKRLTTLARHRVASHVVQSALVHCGSDYKQQINQALSATPGDRAGLASSFYGSYVAQELSRNGVFSTTASCCDTASLPEEA